MNIHSLLQLLLGAKLRRMSALPLPAVGGLGRQTRIALAADALLAVEFSSEHGEGRVVNATTQTQDQVKRGLLLDIVVGQRSSILELFAGENQTLLIGGDALLVLDLRLDVIDGVAGLDIEGDGLAREGFDEYLHGRGQLLMLLPPPTASDSLQWWEVRVVVNFSSRCGGPLYLFTLYLTGHVGINNEWYDLYATL